MKFYIKDKKYKIHLKDEFINPHLYEKGIKLLSFEILELTDSNGTILTAKERRYHG